MKSVVAFFILLFGLETYQLATESTLFTSAFAHMLFTDNLHAFCLAQGEYYEVEEHQACKPGAERLYRSGQMDSKRLEQFIHDSKTHTVVDLRFGKDKPDEDGRTEPDVVEKTAAKYTHFPIVGSEVPSPKRLHEMVSMLDALEQPTLIHCSSGTHRSGVVMTVLLLLKGVPPERAIQQLTPKYGFFAVERRLKSWISGKNTIDDLIWQYMDFYRQTNRSFREFIAQLPENSGPPGPNSPRSTIQ